MVAGGQSDNRRKVMVAGGRSGDRREVVAAVAGVSSGARRGQTLCPRLLGGRGMIRTPTVKFRTCKNIFISKWKNIWV